MIEETAFAGPIYVEMGWPVVLVYPLDSWGRCCCTLGYACQQAGEHAVPSAKEDPPYESLLVGPAGGKREANVALVCGQESGFVAIKISSAHGRDRLRSLVVKHGGFPPTPSIVGGQYRTYIFKNLTGNEIPSGSLADGLRVISGGDFTLLPYSVGSGGVKIQWVHNRAPWQIEVAPLPNWLRSEWVWLRAKNPLVEVPRGIQKQEDK